MPPTAVPCAPASWCAAAPPGTPGLRPYNELMNEAYDTAAARPGWRHYQSPVAKVKPLLASSIAYQFPADSVSGRQAAVCRLGGGLRARSAALLG